MKKTSSVLRITLLSGLILFVLTVIVLTVFYFVNISGTRMQRMQDNFTRALREYDMYANYIPGLERDFIKLNTDLDRLEKMTISVESWLSVLKRRRALSQVYPASFNNYVNSIDKALEIYPVSQPIIALTAEALVKNIAITREADEKLRGLIPALTGSDYNNLRLSLHVLLGDFRNPQRAQVIPDYIVSDGTESVTINLILLLMLKNDIRMAAADVQSMFYNLAPSVDGLRFIAEFFYDFGELERSAEIFSLINDEKSLSRASDALYLAGYTGSARNIWQLLAESGSEKSLYNLGLTSEDREESLSYFENLLSIDPENISDFKQFGLIRYSRLLELENALEALGKTRGLSPIGFPFIDLEICRRQTARWELGRQMAEAWLLIDRHPEDEDLYRWASWLFLFQRNFNEIKILLNRIENFGFPAAENNDYWTLVDRAIQQMFEGNIENAENMLKSIPKENAGWAVFANLGRIMEARRSAGLAVEQYELAMSKNPAPKTAARIQIRMARCYSALNRFLDARRSYEYALELDPGNLTARMELDRY
ncbi:MAG: tetratricopeptide repeat protein [Treponema sp.]|jgi:tetratricopeptide (TPR) repeat protein|nr:tetratricopeptide repeat protein [Treponema sp.]